jgi:exodeoxyribonuclease VII small subunit
MTYHALTPMSPKKQKDGDFQASFTELEEIAAWFERGEPDVDQGLQKFERAMVLSKQLKTRLAEAETVIKQIRGTSHSS